MIAVAVDAAVTGCLHLDGLADAADGLLPAVGRTRRLEIMADPRVGAFGAVALVLVLSLRVTALAATVARPLVVVGLWCGSRTIMGVVARSRAVRARRRGHGHGVRGRRRPGMHSAASRYGVAAYGMGAALRVRRRRCGGPRCRGRRRRAGGDARLSCCSRGRRIGGYTGDVLGAMGVIGETVGLLALAAR